MANTFITQDLLQRMAKRAAIILNAKLVMGQLINRDIESSDVTSSGGTAKVTWVPRSTATRQDHRIASTAITAGEVTEQSQTINLLEYFADRKSISAKSSTFELANFQTQYIDPMAAGLAKSFDDFCLNRACGGFAANASGDETSNPVLVSSILAGRTKCMDNLCPDDTLNLIFGTVTEAALLSKNEYASKDYGEGNPQAVEAARLTTEYRMAHYMSQHAGQDHSAGSILGTPVVNGGSQTGSSLIIDGFTGASRYLNRGTRFSVTGASGFYTLSSDVLIDGSGNATLTLNTALAGGSPSDGATVTFAPAKNTLLFHPDGVIGAVVAPPPLLGATSAVESFGGLSVRVSLESSFDATAGASSDILMDFYAGTEVTQTELGCIVGV